MHVFTYVYVCLSMSYRYVFSATDPPFPSCFPPLLLSPNAGFRYVYEYLYRHLRSRWLICLYRMASHGVGLVNSEWRKSSYNFAFIVTWVLIGAWTILSGAWRGTFLGSRQAGSPEYTSPGSNKGASPSSAICAGKYVAAFAPSGTRR